MLTARIAHAKWKLVVTNFRSVEAHWSASHRHCDADDENVEIPGDEEKKMQKRDYCGIAV